MEKAIEYMADVNLTIREIGEMVGYSDQNYFSRVFKQRTGMSFIAYLTQVRMNKAKELLSTQMSIAEIADAVGYQHRNTFISNFKEYSGLTPNDYRKRFLMGETTDE